MDDAETTFHVVINDGPERTITVRTGWYWMAAIAALAQFGFDDGEETVVKIWLPHLLPDYGPYWYKMIDYGVAVLIPPRMQ